jgi:hypothetical protein
MQVINVIVSHPEQGINEVESFGVLDDEQRSATVSQAEDCFINLAVKYQFGDPVEPSEEEDDFRDDCVEMLDDGYIEAGGHTISLVWSSIDNVQL